MEVSEAINNAIAVIVTALGVYLKHDLNDKKIGNFKLIRLLPLFILVISETLHIAYGFTQGEDIIISISNGLKSAMIATFGYDIAKSFIKRE